MSATPELRKARTPGGFCAPAKVDDQGTLRCTVSYQPSNGPPLFAVLLPVSRFNDRWCAVGRDGHPVERPATRDLVGVVSPLGVSDRFGMHTVDVAMPWPRAATYGLLLLLHAQVEDIGDDETILAIELTDQAALTTVEGAQDLQGFEPHPPNCILDTKTRFAILDATLRSLEFEPSSSLERGVIAARAVREPSHQASARIAFALASCQYPAGVLESGPRAQQQIAEARDMGPAEASLWRLADRVRTDEDCSFVVFAGDQVYVDATAGLFDAKKLLDRLSFAYERMFANKGFQRLLRYGGVDVLPMLDDHEIEDNWETAPAEGAKERVDRLFSAGRRQYLRRQRAMWPGPKHYGPKLYASNVTQGVSVFLADVRSERQARSLLNYRIAEIMSPGQLKDLKAWMRSSADEGAGDGRPMFVVSSSIFLPRLLSVRDRPAMALYADSWCGYPKSLHEILVSAFDARTRGLVFLSGDEHISCLATIDVTCLGSELTPVRLYSIHSSALYAPYPFANSTDADFPGFEEFSFEHRSDDGISRKFMCTVTAVFPDVGDGFALLSARPSEGSWTLTAEFDGERGRFVQDVLL